MSDIFQEIDEDLRQDRAARLWKAYGKYIVALAIFIILAIASYRFIEHKNEKNREQTSELFELANEEIPLYLRDLARLKLFASDSDINISQLDTLIEEEGPWKFLALELKGGIQLQGGNLIDARSTFKELTDDANTPNNLRRRASEILKALP